MKFLTLNCHSWVEDNQEEKIKIIVDTIKEKSYDVIALQEVNQSIEKDIVFKNIKEDNFAYVLLKELKKIGCSEYKMIWDLSHIGYGKYEEGLSIISKHEIKSSDSFFVTEGHDENIWKTRKIVKATIKINEEIVDFYSCHLGWWHDEEEPFKFQADQLLGKIEENRLTFLMGDFNNNAFTRGEGYDYLIDNGFYDTFSMAKEKDKGVTVKGKIDGWDKNKLDLRIDLILANKKIETKYSNVIFNDINKPVVSDHYGVEVEIEKF